MTNVKKNKFPSLYNMKANKMSKGVCPLIHKFVPDRVELPASSHNCFTPVERACDAHFIADQEDSEALLGHADKTFIPVYRNPDLSPHVLD